ncbi:MAG: sigma-70 family RNA polymerase sigma factor [Pirellulales bacterium]|nr:sigma-70 family RNA polymerase sigma factor [Pirellulales bacterium]MBX3432407.1 sigma-70 family RNA polymerase sigma factor [Pirellulales bacterium]
MALSEVDRTLLENCLAQKERAWESFVDRFSGLVIHVINHSARSRSMVLSAADREDLASDVFLAIVDDDFAVLRRFQGRSSLATYLTVIARRIVVRRLLAQRSPATTVGALDPADQAAAVEERISDREEVDRMLEQLDGPDAQVVRMYHLEGKTYQEISRVVGVPVGSVGPVLTRARARLRGTRHAI